MTERICALSGCLCKVENLKSIYCCKAHYNAARNQRRRDERLGVKAELHPICEICHKPIKNPFRSSQQYHKGECAYLANAERERQRAERRRATIKTVECVCECGRTFTKKETDGKRQYCNDPKCNSNRQKKNRDAYRKAQRENRPPKLIKSEKVKYIGQNTDKAYGLEFIDIIAKCPTCGDTHPKRVLKGSCGWIYCEKHESYRTEEPKLDWLGVGFFKEMRN